MPYCEACDTLWIPPAKCRCNNSALVGPRHFTLEQILLFLVEGFHRPNMQILRSLSDLSIPSVLDLGQAMGHGGTNSVYELMGNPMVLAKNAGASHGKSREYRGMVKMEEIGLLTVRRELVQINGTVMILMGRINDGIDSKSIIGYRRTLKDYIDLDCSSPSPQRMWQDYLHEHTITDLIMSLQLMKDAGSNFSDYQFMIDGDGTVIHNDPVDHIKFKGNGGATCVIIQAMINTWEYLNHPLAKAMTWLKFKRLKHCLSRKRTTDFYSLHKQHVISVPALCILDYSALDWSDTLCECVFFRSSKSINMQNWAHSQIDNNQTTEYWYMPQEKLPSIKLIFGSVHYDGSQADKTETDELLEYFGID